MYFNIQQDTGDLVEGYLVPDSVSEAPVILVSDEAGIIAEMPCDVMHVAVVASGRHATGLVGFRLTDATIPNLSTRDTLVIQDARTRLLIYRRPLPTGQIEKKLLRIETQFQPFSNLDEVLKRMFQFAISQVDRYGNETTMQTFMLLNVESVYISGRLLMRSYQEYLDKGFTGTVLLMEPYYELAQRIILLRRLAAHSQALLGQRDQINLAPVVAYFAELDVGNQAAIQKALKQAPPRVKLFLSSPLTRQFACTDQDQPATRRDIASALDLISRFEVIGHSSDTYAYAQSLAEFLECPVDMIPSRLLNPESIKLANELKTMPVAERLIEEDLILDYYVRKAMEIDTQHVL